MFDYHIHTQYSFDCEETMEHYIKRAEELNIKEICFTDHVEFGDIYSHMHKKFDVTKYNDAVAALKIKYPSFIIKQGAEMGLNKGHLQYAAKFVKDFKYDFIIASQHAANNKDPYFSDYFDGISLREGQRIFFEEMCYCLTEFQDYDVIGHIGYVDKYLKNFPTIEHLPAEYKDFPEIFDELLKSAISKNKGIEINTSNIKIWGSANPHVSIIKRFLELKGEIITTGSDCHSVENLAYGFNETYEFLRSLGVKYICTFTQRKAKMRRI